jgi:pimeloyl-ACP methyl ester carboxylesterase
MGAIPFFHVETAHPTHRCSLANSLGTTLRMWDPQVSALHDRFRIVRYDHRGNGDSPVPPGPYSIADIGADLLSLLDRLDVRRADLCGLSLGGMAAMWLAAEAPQRVRRLAKLCRRRSPRPAYWAERAACQPAAWRRSASPRLARWLPPLSHARAHHDRRDAEIRDTNRIAACSRRIEHLDPADRLPDIGRRHR